MGCGMVVVLLYLTMVDPSPIFFCAVDVFDPPEGWMGCGIVVLLDVSQCLSLCGTGVAREALGCGMVVETRGDTTDAEWMLECWHSGCRLSESTPFCVWIGFDWML